MSELPVGRGWVVVLLVAAGACGSPPADESVLVGREAEFAAAVESGDVESFASFLDETAVFLGADGSILEGRAAVVEDWRPLLEDPALALGWEPLEARLSDDGSMGYTYGSWHLTRNDGSGPQVVLAGRYTTIWRRGADGVWRVVLDIGNADEG